MSSQRNPFIILLDLSVEKCPCTFLTKWTFAKKTIAYKQQHFHRIKGAYRQQEMQHQTNNLPGRQQKLTSIHGPDNGDKARAIYRDELERRRQVDIQMFRISHVFKYFQGFN